MQNGVGSGLDRGTILDYYYLANETPLTPLERALVQVRGEESERAAPTDSSAVHVSGLSVGTTIGTNYRVRHAVYGMP